MAGQRPIRLKETSADPAAPADVIDADFRVVRGRRSWLAQVSLWLVAFAAAAAIGFLIPPLWIAVREIGAMIAGN